MRTMNAAAGNTSAVAAIAAMVTPALLILASASLVASALVRMARVVDRARFLAQHAHDGTWNKLGLASRDLRVWLRLHELRAHHAGRSIALLYAAIVVFVCTCLSIAALRWLGDAWAGLPPVLAIVGTMLLLAGGAYMLVESRASARQIGLEIQLALDQLKDTNA